MTWLPGVYRVLGGSYFRPLNNSERLLTLSSTLVKRHAPTVVLADALDVKSASAATTAKVSRGFGCMR
jgi:hypothetical protein